MASDSEPLRLPTLLALTLWAATLRVPTLLLHQLVEGDGVHYAQLARALLVGDWSGLANPYWSNLWPAVIAGASWVSGLDVVAGGRLAALLAGCLLAPTTAVLATRLLGRNVGLLAGLLVAGHPWLIHFSTLVFTESLFALLVASGLLAVQATATGRCPGWVAGLLLGLGIVTRPEASALVAVGLVWLGVCAWTEPRERRRLVRTIVTVAVIVAAFSGLRAVTVHHYYEVWDVGLGSKGAGNFVVGLAQDDRERERVVTSLDSDGESQVSVLAERFSVAGYIAHHPAEFLRHLWSGVTLVAESVARVFPFVPLVGGRPAPWQGDWPRWLLVATYATLLLAGVGLWVGWRKRERRLGLALPVALVLAYLGGLAVFLVHDRLVVAVVPLFLILLAQGLLVLIERVGGAVSPQAWRTWRLLVPLALALGGASLIALAYSPARDYASDPPIQRGTGEWLAAAYPPTTRIMVGAPCVGFYFYDAAHRDNEISIPWGDVATVVSNAHRAGARLIVVPEWHLRAVGHPAEGLWRPTGPVAGLRRVMTLGDDDVGRMFVYEVLEAEADPDRATGPTAQTDPES